MQIERADRRSLRQDGEGHAVQQVLRLIVGEVLHVEVEAQQEREVVGARHDRERDRSRHDVPRDGAQNRLSPR